MKSGRDRNWVLAWEKSWCRETMSVEYLDWSYIRIMNSGDCIRSVRLHESVFVVLMCFKRVKSECYGCYL